MISIRKVTREDLLVFESEIKKEGLSSLSKNTEFFAMYDNNNILGFCGISWFEKNAKLNSIYVLPKYRGKGYGTYLTRIMLLKIKNKNIFYVFSNVTKMALSIHKKLGAKELKKYKNGNTKVEYNL